MTSPPSNEVMDGGDALTAETDATSVDLGAALPQTATGAAVASSRGLLRNTVIYGIGTVLSRAASFIMLPIYTRLLMPADYGLLYMFDVTVEILGLLVSAGCTLGVTRFYFQAKTDEQRRIVVASQYALHVGLNAIGSIVLAAAAVPVWRYGLHGAGSPGMILIVAISFTFSALLNIPMAFMQIERRATLYSLTSVTKLVLQLSLNIVLLVVVKLGPKGVLLSTLITNGVIGAGCAIWLIRRVGFTIRRDVVRELRRFGLPYQVAAVGSFILTFGDRLFLEPLKGLAVVGIYGFAYQFGFILDSMGRMPYARAWAPTRWELVKQAKPIRDAAYNAGALNLSLIVISTAVGIGLFVDPMLAIIAAPSYRAAADLVPLILLAYVFQGWGDTLQFGIDVSAQTKYSSYAVWISVIVIVPLYATLIPPLGAYGAVLATLISFFVRLLCQYRFAQRLWRVDYDLAPHFRLLAVGGAIVAGSRYMRSGGLVRETAGMVVLFAVYLGLTWVFVLDRDQRNRVTEALMGARRRLLAQLGRA